MIAVDWGTSSLRAFRLGADGGVLERRSSALGILHVPGGDFAAVLRDQVGDWLAAGESEVLLSGMVGSRQGWVEAPYLPCPAGPLEIEATLVPVPFDGARVRLVPGLSDRDEADVPEVMRGEETQLLGVMEAMGGGGLACLPGSHSKWAAIEGGRIASFRTYMSGEAFSALRAGTILGRMMVDGPPDAGAFAEGVARSGAGGHLLHHLFGVRTRGLFGTLADTASVSYLSGLLIGHEIRAALPAGGDVALIGAASLTALYASAIEACGGTARIMDEDAAARGLARIAGVG